MAGYAALKQYISIFIPLSGRCLLLDSDAVWLDNSVCGWCGALWRVCCVARCEVMWCGAAALVASGATERERCGAACAVPATAVKSYAVLVLATGRSAAFAIGARCSVVLVVNGSPCIRTAPHI